MNLDELRSLREQIVNDPSAVSDEQIQAAIAAIRARVAAARNEQPTPELVAELEALTEVRDAVMAERDARIEKAAADADKARELLDGLDIPEPEQPAAVDEQDEPAADSTPAAAETTGDQPVADTSDTPQETPVAEETREPELALSASGLADAIAQGVAQALAARQDTPSSDAEAEKPAGRTATRIGAHTAQAAPVQRDAVALKVKAAGSNGSFEHGQTLNSTYELARALHDRFRGDYQARGFSGRLHVARVEAEYPESRVLGQDAETNFTRIEQVTSPAALVAAGGLCAPLETLYDVEVIGSTARPIRDSLPRFQVERGGIQFRPNSSAAAAVNSAGVWTVDDDEAAGGSGGSVKDCYTVDCPGVEDAVIQAIYSCLEFSNITTRFDPEVTAANIREGVIAHARLAERELYRQMATDAKLVQANTQEVGATRHVLGEMDKLIAYYRDRHRLDSNISLTWLAPQWLRDMMRADLAYQMAAGDWAEALGVSQQMVDGWFARRGVQPVWFLDGATTQQTVNGVVIPPQVYQELSAADTIPAFPSPVDTLLFTSGSYLFLDGGSLDLGLVRDSELNSRNRYQQFSETFEGVAFRGVEALRPIFDLCPTGTSSGTVEVVCDAS